MPEERARNKLGHRVLLVLAVPLMMCSFPGLGQASAALMPGVSAAHESAVSEGQAIVNAAKAERGQRYCWDGGSTTGPTHGDGNEHGATECGLKSTVGFDCSGLSLYAVYQGMGGAVTLPHSSAGQASANVISEYHGKVISSESDLLPGDLVFFEESGSSTISHVGIYVGAGDMLDSDVAFPGHPDGVAEVPITDGTTGPDPLVFVEGVRYWSRTGGWGTAIEVPGTKALNTGGIAGVNSVSCASAGDCAAGGGYDGSSGSQAFVVSEVNGTWHTAIEVPGTKTLNTGGSATVNSVSCASAGNCAAGGEYSTSRSQQAFVVSEVNGTWGTAIEVPGTKTLNTRGRAMIYSVSCASAGDCAAGGEYEDSSRDLQGFVVSEVNGTWHTAIEIPGTKALNTGGTAMVLSVSCASAGDCAAGGYYFDSSGSQAFVVSEVNGTWGTAIEVPGTKPLNTEGIAEVNSVSCASAGDCAAGGSYLDSSGSQAFVVSEVNGTWHTAIEVPGTKALNTGGEAQVNSVSCASAGDCAAGGGYGNSSGSQEFVVSEVDGTWGTAIEVPGTTSRSTDQYDTVNSVSCASAGDCAAGGGYDDSSAHREAFVVSEVNGTWETAIEVPGTAALNVGGSAAVNSVSCARAGSCAAGGNYGDSSNHGQAFVVSQS